jgi:hypothetical protein
VVVGWQRVCDPLEKASDAVINTAPASSSQCLNEPIAVAENHRLFSKSRSATRYSYCMLKQPKQMNGPKRALTD